MANGQYIKVYHQLMDEYPEVWHSDRLLATFVRSLYLADKFWPQWAPIPDRKSFQTLVEMQLLVVNRTRTGFKVRGLDKERAARSEHGRHAAGIRWSNAPSNAQVMPSKAEQNKAEQTVEQEATFMGFRHKLAPNLREIERQHAASLEDAIRKMAEKEAGK